MERRKRGGSIHYEGVKAGRIFERALVEEGRLFELLAESGAVANGFAQELAFHAAFVLQEEFSAARVVELGAAFAGFEVLGVEDLVAEEIQREGFDEGGSEGFDQSRALPACVACYARRKRPRPASSLAQQALATR